MRYWLGEGIVKNCSVSSIIQRAKTKKDVSLFLSFSRLIELPSEIGILKHIKVLDVSKNDLTSLIPEVTELKLIEKIDLSSNRFSVFPEEIIALNKLCDLDISSNHLHSLPSKIGKLKNLTKLDLSNNLLSSLPHEIGELESLTQLYISENFLDTLPPEIGSLKKLSKLNISGNELTSLPVEIAKLKNLTQLDISGNQLTSLSPEILELNMGIEWEKRGESNVIFVGDNPFENPPIDIVKKGRKAIIDYFKSLEGEKEPLNEVKVLLVGDGGAGKTSLVKGLLGKGFDGNEHQTQGINIKGWNFDDRGQKIKVNFWDFGGQEIMHATHQFFLSKRSLYILVLDGRKDEKAEYWLKHVENFAGDSPVLVVINKIDENPGFDQNRKFLQEKYPSIRGFYCLSCKSEEGLKEFSESLKEELTKVRHTKEMWAKSWFNVKNRLEGMCPSWSLDVKSEDTYGHCNFIQYRDYKMICEEERVKDESEQNTLIDFLHDLGVILHFKDISLLNTYVLNPEWVTNAVYKIVSSKEVAISKGSLKHDMFTEILKNNGEKFNYPPDQYSFILSLMKKFELSYDLDNSTVLLPSLMEIQEPDYEFDYEGTLRFIIGYDFLPPSVMPRFIVKMNKNIKDDLRWRTGVFLENKNFNSSAVIRADIEAKRISIYVAGNQRRDYFAVILQNFREINNSFEKLKAIEKIPLPDKPEVTVSYDHLIKLELKGIETYMPDGSDNEYNVSDLLGTIINRSNERILLEEMLRIMEMNRSSVNEILKILKKLQEVEEKSDTEDTLIEKLNKIVMAEPNFYGFGLRLNEVVKLYIKSKKSKKV